MAAVSGFLNTAPITDDIKFGIGGVDYEHSVQFPRVRSNFKFEYKPIYTNVNTTQEGVTSQTLVRFQVVISGVNFDPCTIDRFRALSDAMHVGSNDHNGGAFRLHYFDFLTGAMTYKNFIIKSLPITVLTVKRNAFERVQMDSVTFQEV